MKGVRNSLVLALAVATSVARAENREEGSLTLSVAAGNPAPAWIGLNAGLQLNSTLQIVGGVGFFWIDELSIRAAGGGVRVHILNSAFTPMFGGGFSYLSFEGSGSIQGLDDSALLGTLMTGIDWTLDSGLRLAAGLNFHFPISLNFPFLEVGYVF